MCIWGNNAWALLGDRRETQLISITEFNKSQSISCLKVVLYLFYGLPSSVSWELFDLGSAKRSDRCHIAVGLLTTRTFTHHGELQFGV